MIALILILVPYALVPWLMARIFRKNAIEPFWLSYLLNFIILMCYPFMVEWLLSTMRPVSDDARGRCAFPLVLINIILVPFSLILQFIFNWISRPAVNKM